MSGPANDGPDDEQPGPRMAAMPEAPDAASSIALLAAARAGEHGAFEVLYRRHRDELLLAVRAGMGPALRRAMQSEDVLQTVAMEAFQALQRTTPSPGGFRGLLRRLVRHRLIDSARKLRRQKRAAEVALTDTVADRLGDALPPRYSDPRYDRIERALRALPPELRSMIRWQRFEGLSSREIAARTGRSDAAVRQACARAMARLALLMGEQ